MIKPALHILGLPHTSTIKGDYGQCAYTQKTRKFVTMMTNLGYEVYLYASDRNEGKVTELITCITQQEQQDFFGDQEWFKAGRIYEAPYDRDLPSWEFFNQKAIKEIKERIKPGDMILSLAGSSQRAVAKAFPDYKFIEYGIGYPGVSDTLYKVFESWAWRHYIYGKGIMQDFERQYHEVIPNFFELDEFPFQEKKEDYLLFMARPIPAKGLNFVQALGLAGHKIKVAGSVPVKGKNIEWVGYADSETRAELMGKARALLSPTLYVGPFEGVTIEANLCGTPVLTTPWGCYQETVMDGATGFKGTSVKDFEEAIAKLDTIKPEACRVWGERYSTTNVALAYDKYLQRLNML